MKKFAGALVGLMILAAIVGAAAQAGPPTPAPELKKLDYFAGTWNTEATIPPGPWGSGGKFTTTSTGQWQEGSFFLLRNDKFTLPSELGGSGSGTSVTGYDSDKKVYTDERFDSRGQHTKSTGTVSGDTWTWNSENNYGGMTISGRMTFKIVSPTSYTPKYEISIDGGANWMSFWDGKATKQ